MAGIQADGSEQQKPLGKQSAADESEEDKHSSMLRRPRPLFRLASPRLRGAFGERHSDSTNASHVMAISVRRPCMRALFVHLYCLHLGCVSRNL